MSAEAISPFPATDVVVVGGGPAGSTAATMLARSGKKVTLLERDHFPREHIGESLLPASVPVLEELGAREAVEAAGFLPKFGATMVWGNGDEPWSWYFRETNTTYPSSWQVVRSEFDKILLDNSRKHGVDVREGHRVLEVVFEGDTAVGVRWQDDAGNAGTLRAGVIVDCSGQTALIGRARRLRKWDPFFQNLAVYAYFEGAERLPEPDETNILIEAYPEGWMWAIPLHTGVMSVGAVVDRTRAQGRLDASSHTAFLMEQIAQAPRTSRMLEQATMTADGPTILKDWSYLSDEVVGDGWILAGDSACFVDPLFSSGVHLALTSGVLAAAWVNTALEDPELARAAGPVYKDLYYAQYDRFHRMASLFYATNRTQESYFWEARRLLGASEEYSPRHAFIHAVAGQPPAGYERVVIARGELPEDLASSVAEAERGFADRRAAVKTAGGKLVRCVPKLDPELRLERRPMPERGRFAWSDVVVSPMRPEGSPISPMVAAIIDQIDGRLTVAEVARRLGGALNPQQREELDRLVSFAVGTLYIEGAIQELEGIEQLVGA
jgi:flavin-dependent dehydrogenase